jgi:hypothetical protein
MFAQTGAIKVLRYALYMLHHYHDPQSCSVLAPDSSGDRQGAGAVMASGRSHCG